MDDDDTRTDLIKLSGIKTGDVRRGMMKLDGLTSGLNAYNAAAASVLQTSGFRGLEQSETAIRILNDHLFKTPGVAESMRKTLSTNHVSEELAKLSASKTLAITTMVNEMSKNALADIGGRYASALSAQLAASVKIPSIEQIIGRDVLNGIIRQAGLFAAFESRSVAPVLRPIAPARRTPPRERAEVRRFIHRIHPRALGMLDGIYEALPLSNGTGASAYSATELFKLVVFSLVSHADVRAYARKQYGTGTQKHHALELIAIDYSLDATILMTLTNHGQLADDLQDIKHHAHEMPIGTGRARLMEHLDELEDLLVFLAQSIDR